MTIVLFDIDGTLIRTGRAGSRAMNRAFEDLFGIPGAFDGIPMAGRTDKGILGDGASRAGVDLGGSAFHRFRDRYFVRLREALPEPGPHPSTLSRGALSNAEVHTGILPGVQPLLDAIAARTDVFPALLTGNCKEGARIKLEHFGLWKFFRCGAYGDAVVDRNDLFGVAMERALACGALAAHPRDVVVVGDTVPDVACAKAAGARSVAVATGPSDVETLRAAGADVAVTDLSDTEAFLRLL
ncbi:MAG: HAD family hydrolase [Acidobacteria bacterium]|nr:HAD family hydrolase [Acidobacteriota bacterium]